MSIEIPEGVTSIYSDTFEGCSSLSTVIIPVSVTSIGYDAFWSCSNISIVYYRGTSSQWYNIYIDSYNSSLTGADREYNYKG